MGAVSRVRGRGIVEGVVRAGSRNALSKTTEYGMVK